ncbi:DNA POLYMERASE 2 ALPHA 70 KDA SUBUNIT, putative [Babesia bigemina]|uniref:DNA polymerase alpha subunit B n=1 Tax=Babesia bigemina TaxID=5866 RepID=A0A061D916_BABBI|nr:DNA POLYMERASE 2 ALPHA 70 KDA SUBUNIT, putative [Babesia bigemina]CDR96467.1 DNA POLYMERASE 2 ALPHA 70 KDA SUBUNIT, putative [Babesia bigemina]|eukprot:XP_012768653.1 DNA POLYMERASE 2 ALPHA 70 KDA SUBUNIT, putative [Babesia bigemina]
MDVDGGHQPEEVSVYNIADILRESLDSSIKWPLLDDLASRLEAIGGNSREMMKVNRWLKEQLESLRAQGASSVDGARRAQVAAGLLELVENKDAMRQKTLEEIVLRRAPLVESGKVELQRGVETANKAHMSFDVEDVIPEYKCATADAAAVDACINGKITRFTNLFKGYCESKGIACDLKPLKNFSDNDVTAYGRIGAEGDVPLNELNVTVQGTTVFDYGVKAQITNIHALDDVCLFPGQMAAVTGRCLEDKFGVRYVASKLHCGIPADAPMATNHANQKFKNQNIHISVVRGCLLTESLEPVSFNHVFNKIKRDRPHVVFFMGPFVSVRQVAVDGDGLSRIGDITFIYKRFFHEISLLADLSQLEGTKFVIVPHCYDVLSGYPLPQPPLNSSESELRSVEYPDNVVFLSNPGLVRINGVLFGVTSCDPVSGIANNMVCIPDEKRVLRACEQLLLQRSFFPSYPTSTLPSEYAVDHGMLRRLEFAEDAVPDVFLFATSSNNEPFVEFAGERAFVGCHSAAVPKDAVVQMTTEIYIAPQEVDSTPIRPMELENRVSLVLALWRG